MKYFILMLLTITVSGVQASENICEKITSSGEGSWPISEEAFTRENAINEIQGLKDMLDGKALLIEDFASIKHNAFVMIQGYILKKRIMEAQKDYPEHVETTKREFCHFLKVNAYVSH